MKVDKKKLIIIVSVLIAVLAVTSVLLVLLLPDNEPDKGGNVPGASYVVLFDSDGGEKVESQTIINGGLIKEPTAPKKGDHQTEYKFLGWYNGDKLWDFNADKVTDNLVLTARWEVVGIYTPEYLPE